MAPQSPLPPRDGVNAAWVRTPGPNDPSTRFPYKQWRTMAEFLHDRLPMLGPKRVQAMIDAGQFVEQSGIAVRPETAFRKHCFIFYYRDLPDEATPPESPTVLFADDDLIVLDKPPFIATTPRGHHVYYSAVAWARRELDLPELSPLHRLDRLTSGVLVCARQTRSRSRYQSLFERREVTKRYHAVVDYRRPWRREEMEVANHLTKQPGNLQVQVRAQDPVNARSRMKVLREWVSPTGPRALVEVMPITGKTHQIRQHLCELGTPIINDPLYPQPWSPQPTDDDFSRTLQLLSLEVRFTDPTSGAQRQFTSERTLDQDESHAQPSGQLGYS